MQQRIFAEEIAYPQYPQSNKIAEIIKTNELIYRPNGLITPTGR